MTPEEFFKQMNIPYEKVRPRRYEVKTDPEKLRDLIKNFLETFKNKAYLATIAYIDLIDEGKFELVYHIHVIDPGCVVSFRVKIPRDNPIIKSLYDITPAAYTFEREAYDLMGIKFEGHPKLVKPFLLPEELAEEFPLRKDWRLEE